MPVMRTSTPGPLTTRSDVRRTALGQVSWLLGHRPSPPSHPSDSGASDSGAMARRSPVTVAGPRRNLTGLPSSASRHPSALFSCAPTYSTRTPRAPRPGAAAGCPPGRSPGALAGCPPGALAGCPNAIPAASRAGATPAASRAGPDPAPAGRPRGLAAGPEDSPEDRGRRATTILRRMEPRPRRDVAARPGQGPVRRAERIASATVSATSPAAPHGSPVRRPNRRRTRKVEASATSGAERRLRAPGTPAAAVAAPTAPSAASAARGSDAAARSSSRRLVQW
jgi:hypothetical protein